MSLKKWPFILAYSLMGGVSFALAMYLSSMFTQEIQAQDNAKTTEQKEVKKKSEKTPEKTTVEPPPPELIAEDKVEAQKEAVKEGVKQVKKVLGKSDKADTAKVTSKQKSEEAKKKEGSENVVKEQEGESVAPDEGVVTKTEDEPSEESELGLLEGIIENYEYKSLEGRDPFREPRVDFGEAVPLGPLVGASQVLERYELNQLRLTGVIWGVDDPKALVLDPVGQTHVVKKGQRMGKNRGKVVEIREEEIIIMESYKNQGRYSFQTRVIRLSN